MKKEELKKYFPSVKINTEYGRITYSFYDFLNQYGFRICGWYPPKEYRSKLPTYRSLKEVKKVLQEIKFNC